MSEWIPCHLTMPPIFHSILIFVAFYHADGISLWGDKVFAGFYDDDSYSGEKGFYIERISEDGLTLTYDFVVESNSVKVLAWTLQPRRPYKEKFKDSEWSW